MPAMDTDAHAQLETMRQAMRELQRATDETGSFNDVLAAAGIHPAVATGYALGIADLYAGRLTAPQFILIGMAMVARLLEPEPDGAGAVTQAAG